MNYPEIPVCQIRHDLLVLYTQVEFPVRSKLRNGHNDYKAGEDTITEKSKRGHSVEKYSGEMKKGTIKRLKCVLDALISIAEPKKVKHPTKDYNFTFRLNFITLTLPAPQREVTDKELRKKALEPLLEYLKDHYPGISYIWKAERQKNGNLHYHLTTDRYIPHHILKDRWNHYLKKFHFIKEFASKHGHTHPNSTDIHATYNIKNLKAYLVKYMTKKETTYEELLNIPHPEMKRIPPKKMKEGQRMQRVLTKQEAKIQGKTWDCSLHLKKAKRAWIEIDYNLQRSLIHYLRENPEQQKQTEHCQIIFIKRNEWKRHLPHTIHNTFECWKQEIKASALAGSGP